MNRLQALHDAGVSIWLDTLSRELLDSGEFERLIADCAVTGATSNPTIFAAAITGSDRYDDQLRAAVALGIRVPRELFFALVTISFLLGSEIRSEAPVCLGWHLLRASLVGRDVEKHAPTLRHDVALLRRWRGVRDGA